MTGRRHGLLVSEVLAKDGMRQTGGYLEILHHSGRDDQVISAQHFAFEQLLKHLLLKYYHGGSNGPCLIPSNREQ
jgi:hypothetical protein